MHLIFDLIFNLILVLYYMFLSKIDGTLIKTKCIIGLLNLMLVFFNCLLGQVYLCCFIPMCKQNFKKELEEKERRLRIIRERQAEDLEMQRPEIQEVQEVQEVP